MFAALFNPKVRVPADQVTVTVSKRQVHKPIGGTAGRKKRRLRGARVQREGYHFQGPVLESIHQMVIDGGGWDTASLLLPRADPVTKVEFGGTQAELEMAAAYREALEKLGVEQKEKQGGKCGKVGGKGSEET